MADIYDWAAFIRGRWNWTSYGYEKGFPRGCQFTDTDAATEFDGHHLNIETKHHDGVGRFPYPKTGQLLYLRSLVRKDITVFILYGCGCCDNPQGLCVLDGYYFDKDRWEDWRELDLADRRKLLKAEIDRAMGLRNDGDIF